MPEEESEAARASGFLADDAPGGSGTWASASCATSASTTRFHSCLMAPKYPGADPGQK
ncbi:hypothetical protein TRIUR3_24209 [Triticum urartu]|uniref:Uncharacterized protein n=1 Tax=Triticum urartu TaxID=4572 RepID=M8A0T3_TRIUA|nr:hypothetical protein TRIUR3_24209 [Triticum urartu]